MPRIRTTKPEHWNDKELVNISLPAHLLWIGTWNFSDDEGIFENDPSLLRSQVFPRRTDIRLEQVSQWLGQLVKARFLVPFAHNGQGYYICRTFKAHQRIDKPQPSKIPADIILRVLQEYYENVPGSVALYRSGEESKVKGEENRAPAAPGATENFENGKGKKLNPPTVNEVIAFFIRVMGQTDRPGHWPEDKCCNQAEDFFDHYDANGWVQGKGKPIIKWEAAARKWMRNSIKGTFDKPAPQAKDAPPPPPRKPDPPSLNPLQVELNFFYCRWCENPEEVTVISVTPDHYNLLKSARLISFTAEESADIRYTAEKYMQEKGLLGEVALVRLMKAYGVLEFFKQLKAQARETVFDEPPTR